MNQAKRQYHGYRFPLEIIDHAVMPTLSIRLIGAAPEPRSALSMVMKSGSGETHCARAVKLRVILRGILANLAASLA